MKPSTYEEWTEVIHNLPHHKAAGSSQITNEMLQHMGDKLQKVFWKFTCECMIQGEIPNGWKRANIYPIPKPKEWNSQLTNTRPITLLETTRKAMIRLLNNRLAKIFVNHQILKGNQFAGLPGTSTFEPIRILNALMDDAKEQKQEIWVLFQDLSKAYDRVNIFMLRKAMQRLKLPLAFIDLIENIFTERQNSVFTEVGLTDPYEMLVGIDQGEVISPLLWCIYYDPLLCEIEHQELGYNLTHHYRQNIYSTQEEYLSMCVGDLAFMDDTTWITETKDSLETILEIADDFYILNNIKVNKDKSELLVHDPKDAQLNKNPITLNFGNDQIIITPKLYNESARILGVWVNLDGNKKYVIQQMYDEVTKLCLILKRKPITDKQLLYLWNMVVIPRLEYRSQITVLNQQQCNRIVSPFRRFFKNKLNMAITAPNAILENTLIYNFCDFFEVQKQSKITNFFIQINDKGILGQISKIRLKQIQTQEWLSQNPLIDWPYETTERKHYKLFLQSMISLCHQNEISFNINPSLTNRITGGIHSILSFLGNL